MPKILVTPRSVTASGHPALDKLKKAGYEVIFSTPGKQPSEDELLRLLPDCVGYLAGVEQIPANVLEAAKILKVISRNGVGVNNIDLEAAQRLGIAVCKTLGVNSRGVAELAMTLILSLARWVPFSDQKIKAGGWERRKGMELAGKTLGLVGCGNIGRLVAKFALGMEMKVLAFDIYPDKTFNPSPDFRYVPLDEVLSNADVISFHCPASPDGKPVIDGAAIVKMKKGVFLVNTARAEVIDEAALAAALESGQVAGVAIDVFKTEPPTGNQLVLSDKVVATPHIGSFTEESVDRSMHLAVENLLAELYRSE
jgi:D-3-phosphoglycerate dehydrogenase / 2-oxoglutarate reductase